jgi:RNA polymerase sigma factor (sigma-70 family)
MEAHSLARSTGTFTVPRSRKLLAAFSDERLVAQLRHGNEVAFEVLYDRHHAGVLSYCRHMLGSRDEAEDALQQAFVSAHTDIVGSEKPIRFKAWIYTIARNRCLSMLRARREQPTEDIEVVSTAGLSDEVQQRADLKQLLADMQELPEDQRAALILSELGDLSHAEVAEVIGCEAPKVKSLVFQARSGLIERRQAHETPCEEIREQLATLRGGSLRRGPLRRHLKECDGCSAFRDEVRRQRQMVAAVLPVIPTLGLKESALAAVGMGAASTGGGVLVGGGTGAVVAAKAGAAKIAVIALATGGVVGGGVAAQRAADDPDRGHAAAAGQHESATEDGAPASSSSAGVIDDGQTTPPERAAGKEHSKAADEAAAGDPRSDEGRHGDKARKHAGEDGRSRGFEPERGTSNGERARDFARDRGNGHKRGLDKQQARAGANGKKGGRGRGHAKAKRDKPKPEPQRGKPEAPKDPPPGSLKAPPRGFPPVFETPPPRVLNGGGRAKGSAAPKSERPARGRDAAPAGQQP